MNTTTPKSNKTKTVAAAVERPAPTPEEKFEHFARFAQRALDSATADIEEFAGKFKADASYALSWSMGAYEAAAKQKVYAEVCQYIEVARKGEWKDCSIRTCAELLTKKFTEEALRAARYPARSTSPVSNLMEQELASAKVRFLEDIRWAF